MKTKLPRIDRKTKKNIEANVMEGYDDKGNLTMYYWQKEPITTRLGFGNFKVHWKFRLNPVWRLKQWLLLRKGTVVYGAGERLK